MKSDNFPALLLLYPCLFGGISASASPRNPAGSIAQQLGFGIKRAVYYLDTLFEKCNNIDDLNQWVLFMDSYLKCDAESYPTKMVSASLNDICAAWPQRRKCASKLASKLNSCLGTQVEDGGAGTNALHLSDAHMKFICSHANDYTRNLEENTSDILSVEKRSLACFQTIKEPLESCIAEASVMATQTTFCENFGLAKECLMQVSMKLCKNPSTNNFLFTMLEQIQFDIQCLSTNEIEEFY